MAYTKYTWKFDRSTEYEIRWAGNYGAKGEKRAARAKPTPEQVKKQNRQNRSNRVRRLIKANFSPGDLWVTLKYPKGARYPPWRVQKDFENYRKKLKRVYQKRGQELKWIRRIEVGANGGIHIHMLLNRLEEGDTDLVVQRMWTPGHTYYTSIYEEGGYEQLADYITKEPEEESPEYEQLSLFGQEERKVFVGYSSSRNLIRPEPEKTQYRRRTMRKTMERLAVEGTIEPTPGYYVVRDSIHAGVNPYTGMSYLKYTENLLQGDSG